MRLFLLRHAEAVPGTPDASRDLTPHGQRQVALLAPGPGLAALGEVDAIEHSPLVRAVRTAQLLRLATRSTLPLKVLPGLEPEADPSKVAALVAKSRRSRLLVGHNPHLSELAALLLGLPDGGEAIRFRKAGLMALERRAKPDRTRPFGAWSLLWMAPPDLTK
jgi:phosphohistidine phosphatase